MHKHCNQITKENVSIILQKLFHDTPLFLKWWLLSWCLGLRKMEESDGAKSVKYMRNQFKTVTASSNASSSSSSCAASTEKRGRVHHLESTDLLLSLNYQERGTILNHNFHGLEPPKDIVGFTLREQCCISSSWCVVRTKVSDVPVIHT